MCALPIAASRVVPVVVDRGEHAAYPLEAHARDVDQGPDQPEPLHVVLVVTGPRRARRLAGREQAFAQVVLDRRDVTPLRSESSDIHMGNT